MRRIIYNYKDRSRRRRYYNKRLYKRVDIILYIRE